MKPLSLALLAGALLLAFFASSASAATKKPIYVSLGDSLAWSYTKTPAGAVAQSKKGYTELVAAKARKSKKYGRKLVLKRFGCPGETTTSYLTGDVTTRVGGRECNFAKSQSSDALAYLKKNRKRLGFVTLSIGANNFTPCTAGGNVDVACVQRGNETLDKDLPKIYAAIRKAAGSKAKIVVLNNYDPYLALYLRGGDYRELALLTVDLVRQVAAKIATFASREKIKVADTVASFKTTQLQQTTTVNGQAIPVAVAQICAYTFMCQPAPVGPDIHPTDAGYAAIATTIAKVLKIN
jgi:lysophospholipase L1-like esterase